MSKSKSRQEILHDVKRVVIKVGTNVISHPRGGLNEGRINQIVVQIVKLTKMGMEVALVSSGAVAAGMSQLGIQERPQRIPEEQAVAAIGQNELMRLYHKSFREHGKIVAQILLTQADLRDRQRYLNSRNTIFTLLSHQVIPIVNENDTVAVDELYFGARFGDNDTLSALVTNLIQANLLLMLSDVDGFYFQSCTIPGQVCVIPEIMEITPEIVNQAKGTGSSTSKGGMVTKIEAARTVTNCGEMLLVVNGTVPDIIERVFQGEEVGTIFLPRRQKVASRKRWIGYTLQPRGVVTVDEGAAKALHSGKRSLLPSGIIAVEGKFGVGDAVRIKGEQSGEFARGLTNYSSDEVERIKGVKTKDIRKVLGYKYFDEVVNRDDMVIL